jgi:FkbM family methyltransferase
MGIELLDYPKAALRMVVATEAEKQMRVRACFKEPETVHWIEEHVQEGDVFFDVGANVGSYSLIAAHCGARVFAFEPEAMNYGRLLQNIGLNPQIEDRITALPVALWDSHQMQTMYMKESAPGYASHAFERNGKTPLTQAVLPLRLDDLPTFGLPQPHHIKIDVDGYEWRVLNGATFTLESSELKSVLIEVDETEEDVELVLAKIKRARLTQMSRTERGEGLSNRIYTRPYR